MADLGHAVDPDGTEDYLSLNALNTAQAQDLTDGGGDTYTATLTSSGGTADTTSVLFNGWTTAAGNDITIEAAAGDRAVKTGIDTNRYRFDLTDSGILNIQEDYVTINYVQFDLDYSASNFKSALTLTAQTASNLFVVNGCYLKITASGNSYAGINITNTDTNAEIYNTIVTGDGSEGIFFNDSNTGKVYNCAIRGFSSGIERDTGTVTVKNCAIFDNNNDIDGTVTVDFCATDDGDGTNSQQPADWSLEYNDHANGDFTTLTGGDLEDNGVGPATDATVPTTDIDGTTRAGASCDIGPDEIAAAAGVAMAPLFHHHNQMRH